MRTMVVAAGLRAEGLNGGGTVVVSPVAGSKISTPPVTGSIVIIMGCATCGSGGIAQVALDYPTEEHRPRPPMCLSRLPRCTASAALEQIGTDPEA